MWLSLSLPARGAVLLLPLTAESWSVAGGKFTGKMNGKNTHLLVPEARGDKFISCQKLKVTPVTCDWLLACAAKVNP